MASQHFACCLLEVSLIGPVLGCVLNQIFSTGSIQKLVEEEGVSLSLNKTRAHFLFSSCSTTFQIITCL